MGVGWPWPWVIHVWTLKIYQISIVWLTTNDVFCSIHFCTTNYWKQNQVNSDQTSPKPFPQEDIIDWISPFSGKLCVSNNKPMMFQAGGLSQWNFNYHWWLMSSCHTPRFCCWQHKVSDFDFPKHQRLSTYSFFKHNLFNPIMVKTCQNWLKHYFDASHHCRWPSQGSFRLAKSWHQRFPRRTKKATRSTRLWRRPLLKGWNQGWRLMCLLTACFWGFFLSGWALFNHQLCGFILFFFEFMVGHLAKNLYVTVMVCQKLL